MSATLPPIAGTTSAVLRPGASDRDLAARAAAGDPQAFEALYDRYASRVLTLCERILGSSHDAADATQETFIRVLKRLPTLGLKEESLAPYLFTAARHVCFDLRGKHATTDVVDEVPDAPRDVVGNRAPHAAGEDPERSALIGDDQVDVRAACQRLNPRHREVLFLREVEELSYDDIGRVMDMNANAVAQLLSRARLRLRDELRGGALAAFSPGTKSCERAATLLSKQLDGKVKDPADLAWLDQHLADCDRCRLARESLAEAGRSYRMLAPLVPLEVLRRETIAKAAGTLEELRAAADGAADDHREGGDGGAGGSGTTATGAATGAAAGMAARPSIAEAVRQHRGRLLAAAVTLAGLAVLLTPRTVTVSDPPAPAPQATPAALAVPGAALPSTPSSGGEDRSSSPSGARRAPRRAGGGAVPVLGLPLDQVVDGAAPALRRESTTGSAPRTATTPRRRGSRVQGQAGPGSGQAPSSTSRPQQPAPTADPGPSTPPSGDGPASQPDPPASSTPDPPKADPTPTTPPTSTTPTDPPRGDGGTRPPKPPVADPGPKDPGTDNGQQPGDGDVIG
ncbi:sigma-70 family RNA polymerase sigma factor [Conexibacter sp. SYSU D00693]|uniref:sigma-70 family RNA polymerase sigma factor n=1 Tax=Conexibacter sp. SYSU D00693 TaxID=2812560 RepID=UPI00196A3C9C|nr:sigma-70 family RNA polymerase sigma factor [Conexibacter sp. SYSU D00693]